MSAHGDIYIEYVCVDVYVDTGATLSETEILVFICLCEMEETKLFK
jgi:hypothetical protein